MNIRIVTGRMLVPTLSLIVLTIVCWRPVVSGADTGGKVTYLHETFDRLSGWDDWTGGTYHPDITPGLEGTSLLIHGDGHDVSPCIRRIVDISGWTGTFWMELDFRAKSDSSSGEVTNAYVDMFDPSVRNMLYLMLLSGGGTKDTGWQHRRVDLTDALAGETSVEIWLMLEDPWSQNWNQEAWFDNVELYCDRSGDVVVGESALLLSSRIDDLAAQQAALEQAVMGMNRTVAGQTDGIRELHGRVDYLTAQEAALEHTIVDMNQTVAEQTDRIRELDGRVDYLTAQEVALEQSVVSMNQTVADQTGSIQELNGQIDQLQNLIAQQNQTIADQGNDIGALEERNHRLQSASQTMTLVFGAMAALAGGAVVLYSRK